MSQAETQVAQKTMMPRIRLALVALGICFVWGFVLPWVSRQSGVRGWHEQLNEQQIDPTALFYSDLENFEPRVLLPIISDDED